MQNYTDRPTLAAFNEKCSIITGTYYGDGEVSKFIDLGVTPKAVFVLQLGRFLTDSSNHSLGGLAITGFGNVVTIKENGFEVQYFGNVYTNMKSNLYAYLALY